MTCCATTWNSSLRVATSMLIVASLTLGGCGDGATSDDNGAQAPGLEYSYQALPLPLEYRDLCAIKASFGGENLCLLYATLETSESVTDREMMVVVLDGEMDVALEMPYDTSGDMSIHDIMATPDGGFWTLEGPVRWEERDTRLLRLYDSQGGLRSSTSLGEMLEGADGGYRILAVDSQGRAYVAVPVAGTDPYDGYDNLALIDTEGELVRYWEDEFPTSLWLAILDDGTPIALAHSPSVGYLFEIGEDGVVAPLGTLAGIAAADGYDGAPSGSPGLFAGVGRTVFFHGGRIGDPYTGQDGYYLMRLTLDDMHLSLVADWSELAEASRYSPTIDSLHAESENKMYAVVRSDYNPTLLVFEK